MNSQAKKTLLFIEPCPSHYPLVLKARDKQYRTLVISSPSHERHLPESITDAASSFFQVNTQQDASVLDLIKKIAQKFTIDGVICGTDTYLPLTSKVASYLKVSSYSPRDVSTDALKAHTIDLSPVERALHGKDYTIQGFLRNNVVSIISFTEKILSLESDSALVGHIISSETDPHLVILIEPYLKKVIASLGLKYGPFCAHVRLSQTELHLVDISMSLAEDGIPALIQKTMGIDYYDNVLKLLSAQPLSLQRRPFLNGGLVPFPHPNVAKTFRDHPYVKEIQEYEENNTTDFLSKQGHIIFLHEDYHELKKIMRDAYLTRGH